jgi:hypothetical protein
MPLKQIMMLALPVRFWELLLVFLPCITCGIIQQGQEYQSVKCMVIMTIVVVDMVAVIWATDKIIFWKNN